MKVDPQTLRDLEVISDPHGAAGLIGHLDRSSTRGGRNAFARRLGSPLGSVEEIEEVQAALRFLIGTEDLTSRVPGDAEVHALARYIESNFATLRRLRGPMSWYEALTTRLRYPEVYEAAMDGNVRLRAFVGRMREMADALRAGPPLVSRMAAEMDGRLSDPALRASLSWDDGGLRWHRVLKSDRLVREEGRTAIRELIGLLHELDGMVSMARATRELGLVLPEFERAETVLSFQGLRHPFLDDPVENPVNLGAAGRVLFLTGPNMAGKTTYLKACGIAVLLAHCGMGVPARAARLSPVARLLTAIRREDNLREGVSYFQAEARQVRGILEAVTTNGRCLVIVDELFRGTNVKDALEATAAVMRGFAMARESYFLVASHLSEVADRLGDLETVRFSHFGAGSGDGSPDFSYRLAPGLSTQRLGMEVLRREGVLEALELLSGPPDRT